MSPFATLLVIFCLVSPGLCASCGSPFEYADVDLPGECPEVSYITNTNFSLVTGTYYIIEVTAGLFPLCDNGGDCLTTVNTRLDDETYNLDYCCKQGCGYTCGLALGSGTVSIVPGYPGVLEYQSGEYVAWDYILDGQPGLYAVIYSCFVTECGQKVEFVMLISQTPTISQPLRDHVNSVYAAAGVDPNSLTSNSQYSTCPYSF